METYSRPDDHTFEVAALDVFLDCLEILCRKRQERGTANIEKQGLTGIVQRMQGDKLERVRIWARNQQMRQDLKDVMPQAVIDQYLPVYVGPMRDGDTIEDDLMDVANYAAIAILLMDNRWSLKVSQSYPILIQHIRRLINKPEEFKPWLTVPLGELEDGTDLPPPVATPRRGQDARDAAFLQASRSEAGEPA